MRRQYKKLLTLTLFIIGISVCTTLDAKGGKNKKEKNGEEKELLITLTPANYEDVISKGIVFVDYWASWCGPCRRMNVVLQSVAEDREGTVTIGKLNTDMYHDFTVEKGVSGLPTIIIYKDGKELARTSGFVAKEKLIEVVDYLASVKE